MKNNNSIRGNCCVVSFFLPSVAFRAFEVRRASENKIVAPVFFLWVFGRSMAFSMLLFVLHFDQMNLEAEKTICKIHQYSSRIGDPARAIFFNSHIRFVWLQFGLW